LNFLFWNVCKKDLEQEIADLVVAENINILILAEYEGDNDSLLRVLAKKGKDFFIVPIIACFRIKIFTNFNPFLIKHLGETDRYTIKELQLKGSIPILLAMAHLPSKRHANENDQLQEAAYFKKDIEKSENDVGHQNTLIVGDFNMNPFDLGMVAANGLHSIPCLKTAKRNIRTIKKKEYSYFYNPMWNLLGDYDGIPGSYYYRDPSYLSYYWNLLDQVVIRPNIANNLNSSSLRILTNTGNKFLVDDNGRPKISDHLPLTFSLNTLFEAQNEKSVA
jgi:hypothetical protein